MKPPGPVGHGPGLCPRRGAVAAYLPANVSCARPHRSWGRAFSLPFLPLVKIPAPGGRRRVGAAHPPAAGLCLAAGMFWGRGQRPRPQNAAAPRMSAPAFLRPQGNRRIADGCTPARGSRLPLGARRGGGGALRALKSGSRRLCLRFPLFCLAGPGGRKAPRAAKRRRPPLGTRVPRSRLGGYAAPRKRPPNGGPAVWVFAKQAKPYTKSL